MKITNTHTGAKSFKKSLSWLCVSACLATSNQVLADDNGSLALGSPASFLEQAGVSQAAQSKLQLSNSPTLQSAAPASFTLKTNQGAEIQVSADDFSVEEDGTVSITGSVSGVDNSEFILQGNGDKVYGWVILRDEDTAYEYTTEDGGLVVNEVDVTDVHPVCDLGHHKSPVQVLQKSKEAETASAHLSGYNGQHLGRLESKPGSSYVLLLDMNRIMSNGVPYDVSREFIYETWQIVAASFSMFDLNVTTDWNVYNAAAPSRRGGGTFYRESGRSSCHFAFGTSTFCTMYKESSAKGQGLIAAHEYGHLFHLKHDSGYGGEYSNGHSAYQWVPMMANIWTGISWNQGLFQWTRGEYAGAYNIQDHFQTMTGFMPFESDDISGTKSLVVGSGGSVSAAYNKGQIERNTDSDSFSFTITKAGYANLNIDRTEYLGMLDVQAYIRNSSGQVVAQSNNSVNRSASFNEYLQPGNYTLEITGGAEASPSNGFSKYSSLGHYAIQGSISGEGGGGTGGGDSTAFTDMENGDVLSGASHTFTWEAGSADSFWIYAGSAAGEKDYYTSGSANSGTSETVTGLPTDGSTVHVTLWYKQGSGSWQSKEYNFVADGGVTTELGLTSPADGDTLTGSSQEFTWETGDATQFWIYAGSSAGEKDYYTSGSVNSGTSETVTGLPQDGSTVHVTFWYKNDSTDWKSIAYTYTADTISNELGITSPVDGGNLTGSSQTFTWNPGQAEGFWFYAGSSQGAQDYYRNPSQLSGTSHTVTGLPTDGSTVHITFHYLQNGSWNQKYYTYTADTSSQCNSAPAMPSGLAGTSSSVSWSAATGATNYDVQYWTGAWTDLGSTTATSYSLGLSGTQYIRVRATNNCGESAYTNWVAVY